MSARIIQSEPSQPEIAPSVIPSDTLVIVGNGEPLSEDAVRFRLLYSGPLLGASKNDTRSGHKHEVRKRLSPQLKRLWENKKALTYWLQRVGNLERSRLGQTVGYGPEEAEPGRLAGLELVANQWKIQNARFIPLVTSDILARCRLDILFLRPEEKDYILQGGDLDNRIKTLFDAFRMPKPNEDFDNVEDPCFVLLEDDSLISEISIVTDNLLMLPNELAIKKNDAFLVIDVQIESRDSKMDESHWSHTW